MENNNFKITIKKTNTDNSIFIEVKDSEIMYYNKQEHCNNEYRWIEPYLISDVQLITKIKKELYFSISDSIKKYKQDLETIETRDLIRPKNNARYDLEIFDEDFYVALDLYVTQTPKVIYVFCESMIEIIKNHIRNNEKKDEIISLNELIKINTQPDVFWEVKLKQFFEELVTVSESEKIVFLKKLLDKRDKFNEFTRDVNTNQNAIDVFNKYNI